jgi:uncharacterized repeat protein (TIGR03803 family)
MRNGKQSAIYSVRAGAAMIGVLFMLLATAVSPAQDEPASPDAVKFKTLLNFDGTNGGNPGEWAQATLVQGTDGNLYGTTAAAGAYQSGNLFKMTPRGALTVLYDFCAQPNCADGGGPGGLVLGINGNFYGTTTSGGAYGSQFGGPNAGTVFKITPSGTLTVLYSFCALTNCADGSVPSGLVQGADGNLYGTTQGGGAYASQFGGGTVFKITPEGAFWTLYSFCSLSNCADGSNPTAAMIPAGDWSFYGTTAGGGLDAGGTMFRITPEGAFTTLYSFCSQPNCTDGDAPRGGLVQAPDGNFYGTTQTTVFKIAPAGALTTLYTFCAQHNCADGSGPYGTLVHAADGDFYGTTSLGGNNSCQFLGTVGCGTVFKITPGGSLTTLHSFDGTDGEASFSGLVQATNGAFYGTTLRGASNDQYCDSGCGTVFAVSVGLGPFVETLPTIGKIGEGVRILGTDLTGATSVCFDGRSAEFKVVSPTEIVTRVPAGATTGFVTVTTPTGMLKSNARFRVLE